MPASPPTLHLFCGKIATGKSTLAQRLAERPGTILISEDDWNAALFRDELKTVEDYGGYSRRLCDAMGPHVIALLKAGLSVALDFQANTVARRRWMRTVIDTAQAAHALHVLDVSDETCRRRLRERNAAGVHPFQPTDADFETFTRYFVPPTPDEGFNVVVHRE